MAAEIVRNETAIQGSKFVVAMVANATMFSQLLPPTGMLKW